MVEIIKNMCVSIWRQLVHSGKDAVQLISGMETRLRAELWLRRSM